ncbi:tellurite resistance TerB family protein [Streptomyces aureocirculatus]|uniref:tellurite resistance TerB family protein n=1 Tax=Streptomyces aureocirculatus TaxID=67275 RepID=UPI0004C6319B|nr:TerB family tellurite resistance protein [Streptomyces aureocirculatus]
MAMWDRIKDQAKGLQQSQGSRSSGGHGQSGPMGSSGSAGPAGSGSSGSRGSKAQLVGMLKSQLTSLKTELKSGAYRDASMAMCALVAAADGNVDPAERQHVETLILQNDVLQNFPPEQLRQRFNKHVDKLSTNFQQGKAEAMQEIVKASKKQTEAKAVVQTGFVVAGADGYIAPAEEQVLREVCQALGVSPQEFGL